MRIHLPAFGPDLPIHPRTGLTALGLRRNGQPIWPVRGASPDDPGEVEPGGEGDDPEVPPGTGDAGKQAIDRMKSERNAARKELRDAQAKLTEYEKAEQAKVEADKTEAEKRAAAEQRAAEAELRATRLEVAHEKGLTPAQAKRLVGSTREELAADADEILRDFPTAAAPERRAPKPDPSQGARSESGAGGSVAAGKSLYQQKHTNTTAT
ncbi:hypothetical protein AB0B48_08995 [Micromonospora sp. NPDC049089]|uniref:hypothetical protein n=1 Tax=Micromonospora sp. NPDC049089 TaxID=3155496 RepID=UPI00340C5091